MKKMIPYFVLVLLIAFTTTAVASDKTQVDVYDQQEKLIKSVVFVIGQDRYFVNNQTPGVKMDAAPFIESGRTFVPIRYLSNALGVQDEYIGWESPRVGLNQPGMPVVELAVGSKQIKSDGQAKTMDVAPLLKQSRTYLPARWVAEALGYEVAWDAENSIVLCWPKGEEKPDISSVIEHITGQEPATPVEPVEPVEPIEPPVSEPTGNVIDLTGKGESIAKYPWVKYLTPEYKINWLTYEEFNNNVYQLGTMKTYGMRVTKDKVYFTLENGCGTAWLYEGGDVLRVRGSSGPTKDKYEYGYSVVNDRSDQYGNGIVSWPTADIAKISHIFLTRADTIIAVENPLYKGGDN